MKKEEILEQVKIDIISIVNIGEMDINEEYSLYDDLGMDSLDMVETVIKLERSFDITISDQEAETLRTVGDIVALIEGKVKVSKKTDADAFKARLEREQNELEERLSKLNAFLISEKFNDIDDVQQALLAVQAAAMNTYLQCLKSRMKRL